MGDWKLALLTTVTSVFIRLTSMFVSTSAIKLLKLVNLNWKSVILVTFGSLRSPISFVLGMLICLPNKEIIQSNLASVLLSSALQALLIIIITSIYHFRGIHRIDLIYENNVTETLNETVSYHRVVLWIEKWKKNQQRLYQAI